MSSHFGHGSEPPPQPRPRAQAAIAAQITAAEVNRDKWAKAAKGLKAAGQTLHP